MRFYQHFKEWACDIKISLNLIFIKDILSPSVDYLLKILNLPKGFNALCIFPVNICFR
jgi:hypothetical protein